MSPEAVVRPIKQKENERRPYRSRKATCFARRPPAADAREGWAVRMFHANGAAPPASLNYGRGSGGEFQIVTIVVRDNNVDQALKALKKKMQREGVFREMKARTFFEKPSEANARRKAEAIRRARKLARKRAQREGLLPKPVSTRP